MTAASYEALTPAGTPADPDRIESFIYDALGNRKGSNVVAGRGTVTFYRRDNGLNQYSSWTPSAIYYDDNYPGGGPGGNGVTMAEGWITASYNALNQPIAIWSPAYSGTSNYMWFGFDPLGRCVKRWVSASGAATTNPATYLYYDGWNLIQEGTGSAAAERIYLHGNRVDGIVCHYNYAAAQWRYHHYDARGHCILLTDPSGNLIEQYEYDAFGKPYFFNGSGTPLPNGSAAGNRFLFTGREWLSDLNLYDYRHRLYQPELGRFLQPDPKHFAAGDYNLYRYCHNDPINKTDPFGLEIGYSFADPSNQVAMEAHLVRLERMGGEIASTVKQLRDSPNKIVFGDIQRNVAGWDKNNLPPRDPKDNTFRTTPRNDEKSRNGEGTGSYVEINPKDWNSASGKRDPIEGAGHEVRHAAANDKGNRLPGAAEEKRAQQFQLQIRKKIQEGK